MLDIEPALERSPASKSRTTHRPVTALPSLDHPVHSNMISFLSGRWLLDVPVPREQPRLIWLHKGRS